MSIRTTFNPLGTLGGELPYMQPAKTGYGLNDNDGVKGVDYSFGFSVSKAENWFCETWYGFVDETKTWVAYYKKEGVTVLEFEKPIKLLSMSWATGPHGNVSPTVGLDVEAEIDGAWVNLFSWRLADSTIDGYAKVENPIYSQKLKIRLPGNILLASQYWNQLTYCKIDAVYRP